MAKRRRSSAEEFLPQPVSKKSRSKNAFDHLSDLSDELLIRILHHLPIETLLQCQRISHRFYTLAGDSQIWKYLYYNRFVLPRALRIPGIKTAQQEQALHFSSRRSKWLDDDTLVNRVDGKKTNWKGQYKLRHNWSIGVCEMQEIHVADKPSVPSMLVRLAERIIITADREEGLRAWDLKGKSLIAKCDLGSDVVPTCLAVDEQESESKGLGIAVGFVNGGWGTWILDVAGKIFSEAYRHPSSSNGRLSAVAFAYPYILTITDAQLLSLYTFAPKPPIQEVEDDSGEEVSVKESDIPTPLDSGKEKLPQQEHTKPLDTLESSSPNPNPKPRLLASLKSHTCWPPMSLSIRKTSTTLIASIAYSLPTYLSGYTIGLQELHLSLLTSAITFSRLASALPQGFSTLSSSLPSSGTSSPIPSPQNHSLQNQRGEVAPTSLSYSHPYILATHPDNTLTLYLCTSTSTSLTLTPGTKLWGHTSSVSSAEITPRGKAVSVSTRGNELRVWELEGGVSSPSSSRKKIGAARHLNLNRSLEKSVRINSQGREEDGGSMDGEMENSRKRWVGFDDEVVIVLKESGRGTQALMVYDFT